MSKLFWDQLAVMDELEEKIKSLDMTEEERVEIWLVVDEIIHHQVMGCILDSLPSEHHQDFLNKFHERPHDEEVLFAYLAEKAGGNIVDQLREKIDQVKKELLVSFDY